MAEQNTLRATLEQSFDTVTGAEETKEAPQEAVKEVKEETQEQKEAAERLRDTNGRFVSQSDNKKSDKTEVKAEVKAEPQKPRPQRPASWKKEYWDQWEKLDPNIAEYINQREKEYLTGVTTYKTEADKAKGFIDIVAPYQGYFDQYGVTPQQVTQTLLNAHMRLISSPQDQRMGMIMQLARDYGIDLSQYMGQLQGQPDPRLYQLQSTVSQLQGAVSQQQQYFSALQRAQQAEVERQIAEFSSSEKHPHFEAVRKTMAGLLQTGQASTLDEAYGKSVRLHDDIWAEEQNKLLQAEIQKREEAARQTAQKAKSAAVSPKSSAPTGNMKETKGNRTLRESLSESYDEHVGRV